MSFTRIMLQRCNAEAAQIERAGSSRVQKRWWLNDSCPTFLYIVCIPGLCYNEHWDLTCELQTCHFTAFMTSRILQESLGSCMQPDIETGITISMYQYYGAIIFWKVPCAVGSMPIPSLSIRSSASPSNQLPWIILIWACWSCFPVVSLPQLGRQAFQAFCVYEPQRIAQTSSAVSWHCSLMFSSDYR